MAAGGGSLEHLGAKASGQVKLKLIGDAKGTQIHVFAPQTIFE